ncbi:MAG: RsmB/NOP family class I SAM-dependent RNA methyltransferase [Bdellovibrionaceae bacterium]|nr:RsmB/NOP family class I SAM-dependent RNA methyltransferase [Bdellovibrio sp.]
MALPLHPHLVDSIVEALDEIFIDGRYADKVIEKIFKKNRKWGSRDRKFIAEAIYEIVRHKRRLEYIVNSNHSWDLVGAYLYQSMNELPNWEEFDQIDIDQLKKRNSEEKPPEIANSFPDWLHELGKAEFKDQWTQIMNALNRPAEVFLRVNTLRAQPADVIAALASEEIQAELVKSAAFTLPHTLRLAKRKNVFTTQAFRKGMFEVQDAGSQLVAPLLQVAPGLRVVDACAGAGGKSLHLAAMMKNKGKVISMDIHEWKLKELKIRAARDGVDIIETKVIESNKTIKRLENSFDRVLLDVPCSGLGVLRRNPDTKWKLSIVEIERLMQLQREIISSYSALCKAGGLMVYATCSILHRENEDQVKWFLASPEGAGWTLEKEERVWPHTHGFDGFYAAVLKKT